MKKDKESIPASGMILSVLVLLNTIMITEAFTSDLQISGWMFLSLSLLLLLLQGIKTSTVKRAALSVKQKIDNYIQSHVTKAK